MNWEYIGAAVGRFFLRLTEYCFKGIAVLSAGIALAAPGAFADKYSAGFTSLTGVIRNLFELPAELRRQAFLVDEFNSMPPAAFSDSYGADTVSAVFAYFGNVTGYLSKVGENLSGSFFATISAAALLFGLFYLLARVLRFARQKGQGSRMVRLERKLAEKIFNIPGGPATVAATTAQTPSDRGAGIKKKPRSKSKDPVGGEVIPTAKPGFNAKDKPKAEGKAKAKTEAFPVHKEASGPKPKATSKMKPEPGSAPVSAPTPTPKTEAAPKAESKPAKPAVSAQEEKEKQEKEHPAQKKKRKRTKPVPPPPKRNEPDWLTNARRSTKEYRQAKASD